MAELPDGGGNITTVRYVRMAPRTIEAILDTGEGEGEATSYGFVGWEGDPAIAGRREMELTVDLGVSTGVDARFAPCGSPAVAAMLDADLALNQPGMPPVGWRVVPGGAPVVVAAGAPGTAGAAAGPWSVTVGGASYGGAWLERFQPYGDTETVFSFRFGAEARADQALVVHTRYTDHEHRVALRVTREGVQLINRGDGEPDPLPVVFAAHPAARVRMAGLRPGVCGYFFLAILWETVLGLRRWAVDTPLCAAGWDWRPAVTGVAGSGNPATARERR